MDDSGIFHRDRLFCVAIVMSKIRKKGAGFSRNCSSGSPDPWPVARGPVPRDRSTRAKTEHRPTPFPLSIEAWRGTGPRPTVCSTFFHRRAGACPPRSLACANAMIDRCMARDRPSPYGERETASSTVARGPVPRDRSIYAKTERQPTPFPRPLHGEGQALALR